MAAVSSRSTNVVASPFMPIVISMGITTPFCECGE